MKTSVVLDMYWSVIYERNETITPTDSYFIHMSPKHTILADGSAVQLYSSKITASCHVVWLIKRVIISYTSWSIVLVS